MIEIEKIRRMERVLIYCVEPVIDKGFYLEKAQRVIIKKIETKIS
jgi:hypothetical protein